MAKTGRPFTIAWLLFAASLLLFRLFRGVSLPGDWLGLLLLVVVLGFYGARRWILSAATASRLERELCSDAQRTDELIRRMHEGSSKTTVFMPWLGEYGHFVMYWIRYVHFFDAGEKVVCCRRGDEIYFPSANLFVYDWRDVVPDRYKVGTGWKFNTHDINSELRQRLRDTYTDCHIEEVFVQPTFAPFANLTFPLKPGELRGLKADVVLGCRRREYAAERNWQHWAAVVDRLKAEGFTVGLIGRQETSFDLPSADVRSWEYDDASANIELLQNCKLYLGSDTGTSHLAAFCSTPMIVFRDPGPWPLVDRMAQTTKSFFKFLPEAWDSPAQVIEAALSYLKGLHAQPKR